jgi:hypothetical protein
VARNRAGAVVTQRKTCKTISLRRHYPDQVLEVAMTLAIKPLSLPAGSPAGDRSPAASAVWLPRSPRRHKYHAHQPGPHNRAQGPVGRHISQSAALPTSRVRIFAAVLAAEADETGPSLASAPAEPVRHVPEHDQLPVAGRDGPVRESWPDAWKSVPRARAARPRNPQTPRPEPPMPALPRGDI